MTFPYSKTACKRYKLFKLHPPSLSYPQPPVNLVSLFRLIYMYRRPHLSKGNVFLSIVITSHLLS